MICKNCNNNFDGNFCNDCGQKANVRRIDFKYLMDEIANSIFQIDHGFFYTLKNLFIHPGYTIKNFIAGKRKPLLKPIAYVLFTATLYVITTYFTGKNTYLIDVISGITEGVNNNSEETSNSVRILNWLANNHAYSTLLLLPFFTLASYLAFIKSKYNYFEHLVLNFYITGQHMVIYLILSFIFNSYYLELIPILLGIIYTFWVYNQFFEYKKFFSKFLLTLLTCFFYTIFLILFLVIVIFIGMI